MTAVMLAQIYPPLCALALFNCIAATIQDRDKSKLKLKRIPFGEGTIEHIDGMAKSDLF
jgi:hypothetical protein